MYIYIYMNIYIYEHIYIYIWIYIYIYENIYMWRIYIYIWIYIYICEYIYIYVCEYIYICISYRFGNLPLPIPWPIQSLDSLSSCGYLAPAPGTRMRGHLRSAASVDISGRKKHGQAANSWDSETTTCPDMSTLVFIYVWFVYPIG